METEIMQSVLTEVLEELKEVKQQQEKAEKALLTLTEKVEGFEQKLSAIKVTPPAVNLTPVITTIMQELDKINNTIGVQPKSITRQVRILLFPEYNAREYYGLVFGRVLMWMFLTLIAAYLFALSKEYIEVNATVKQAQSVNDNIRKVWKHESKHIEKPRKIKIDTVNMRKVN